MGVISDDFALIEEILDKGSFSAWWTHLPIGVITRRKFLIGSAGAVALIAAGPALASDAPQIRRDPRGRVEVSYRGKPVWAIDPMVFSSVARGGTPQTSYATSPTNRPGHDDHIITLANARLPGFPMRVDFVAEIYERNSDWYIRLQFQALTQATELELGAWLDRDASKGVLVAPYLLPNLPIGSAKGLTARQGGGRLTVDSSFSFGIERTDEPFTLEIGSYSAEVDKLTLQASLGGSRLFPVMAKAAAQPVTMLEVPPVASSTRPLDVGRLPDGTEVRLVPDFVTLHVEAYDRPEPNALVLWDGCGELSFSRGRLSSPTTRLQAERVCFVGLANDLTGRSILGAHLARRTFGAEIGSFAIEVQGKPHSPIILRVHDGRLPPFHTDVELLTAHVPVRGSSAAEVSFPAIDLHLEFGSGAKELARLRDDALEAAVQDIKDRFAAEGTEGCPQPQTPTEAAPPATAQCEGALLVFGPESRLTLPLEEGILRLRRSTDLFNLSFGFHHYEMQVIGSETRYHRRWAVPRSCAADSPDARIIVHFPPQHLFEEVGRYQERDPAPCDPDVKGVFPKGACPTPKPTPTPAPGPTLTPGPSCKGGELVGPDGCRVEPVLRGVEEIDIARTRISGPTRIVFADKRPIPEGEECERDSSILTIESLTDWEELALVVHHRALPAGATLEEQLAAARPADHPEDNGIDEWTDRGHARTKILQSLTPPTPWQTAIELPYRLFLSPDSEAKFDTPRNPPLRGDAPRLWHARMRRERGTAVRAIYARNMSLKFLDQVDKDDLDDIGFVGSMSALDRRELVGLTSVYGVPALRRLKWKQDNNTVFDDPRGMVVRPQKTYQMLDEPRDLLIQEPPRSTTSGATPTPRSVKTGEEGFILAKPFQHADILLSSVGGTLSARWIGEPPAPLVPTTSKIFQFFKPAYTVEKYVHRTALGRDVYVEVNYKGFVFPLGHRATLIKVSERRFLPHRLNPEFVRPTAYLAQRTFLVVKNPRKTFPAMGQDFASRDFPCDAVEILTTTTPDLFPDPKNFAGIANLNQSPDEKCQKQPLVGRAFWPSTGADARNSAVLFEYKIAADAPPLKSPLLFVDNAAAHDPPSMSQIVKAYREDPTLRDFFRVAQHGDAARVYAEARTAGETTYQTGSWVLSARGRIVLKDKDPTASPSPTNPKVETEDFTMDAFMEGDDQPPFYPFVEQASVTMQSLDRLLGRTQGPVTVAFNGTYVRHGFDTAQNPSEIYLDVIGPQIQLDVSGQGESAGGVAKPNSMLAAVSRQIGFVGGAPSASAQPAVAADLASVAAAPPVPVGNAQTTFDFKSAAAGRFDPIEFFGGALKDAKLLGLVPLKDVLRAVLIGAAPKLQEKLGFSPSSELGTTVEKLIETTRKVLRDVTPVIRDAVDEVLNQAEGKLRQLNQQLGLPQNGELSLDSLYPELNQQLLQLKATSVRVLERVNSTAEMDIDVAVGLVADLLGEAQRLVAVTERLCNNPVPAIITKTLADIQKTWATVQRVFSGDATQFLEQLRVLITDQAFERICDGAIDADLFPAFFGRGDLELAPFQPFDPDNPPDWRTPLPQTADRSKLEEACKRFLTAPGEALPRLQEALFFEVFSGPAFAAIDALKRLDGEARGLIAWSRQELTRRVVGVLRAVTAEVNHATLPGIAWRIVAEIEVVTQSDLGSDPLGTLQSRLDDAAKRIENLIRTEIVVLRQDLQAACDLLVKEHNQLKIDLDAAKAAELTFKKKELEQLEKALQSQIDAAKDTLERYDKIAKVASVEAKAIAASIVLDARRDFEAKVRAQLELLKNAANQQLTSWGGRVVQLVDAFLDAGLKSALFGELAAIGAKATGWCVPPTPPATPSPVYNFVVVAQGLASGLLARSDEFGSQAGKLLISLEQAQIPAELPSDIVVRLQQGRATLAQHLQTTIAIVAEIQRARNEIQDFKPEERCLKAAALLDVTGRAIELRRKAVQSVTAVIESCREIIVALDPPVQVHLKLKAAATKDPNAFMLRPATQRFAAAASVGDSLAEIGTHAREIAKNAGQLLLAITSIGKIADDAQSWKDVSAGLTSLEGEVRTSLNSTAEEFKRARELIVSEATRLRDRYVEVSSAIGNPDSLEKLRKLSQEVETYAVNQDRQLAGLVLRATQLGNIESKLDQKLRDVGIEMVSKAASALLKPHQIAVDALDHLSSILDPASNALVAVLTTPVLNKLGKARDAVAIDTASLSSLATLPPTASVEDVVHKVGDLRKRWQNDGIGLIVAGQILSDLLERVTKGQIDAIFDFRALEGQLRDLIAKLVPAQVDLHYDFDSELAEFPSGDGIFAIDRDALARQPNPPKNDLVLSAHVQVNLITGERHVEGSGQLRPFMIRLLGQRLDLVTIHFGGATFTVTPGGAPSFKADVTGVKLGQALSYIEEFSSLFGSGKENGPYVLPSFAPPSIEVGYRFSKPLISIGELQIHNLGVQVAAMLPFDDRGAEFRFSFASRARPFLIAAPPYGGGGFLALTANTRGIVGFEMSLEFGAVMAIEFGPLDAHGRLTAGIYLMTSAGGTRLIEGFVHAVGEGNIACFGICVNIEVGVKSNGSNVQGYSSYEFAFKIGRFFEVKYGFEATYQFAGGSGGGSPGNPGPEAGRLAPEGGMRVAHLARKIAVATPTAQGRERKRFIRNVPVKNREWNDYRKLVVLKMPTPKGCT